MGRKTSIKFGVDILLEKKGEYNQKRIGLVTNDAAYTATQELSRLVLLKSGFNIIKLFSPEHGISAKGEDGTFQNDQYDDVTGLPIISLYADKLKPTKDDLDDIEMMLFDLPDIGCRFYTYQWTLSYIMEACAAFNKPLVVLDRPNPLSGNLSLAEGPVLDEINCSSFIGRWNIPIRHSLTIGELACYWNTERGINADLEVIKINGWERNLFYDELTIPFVPTSPAISDFITALLYPGTGLLESITINEGRGTRSPFKICGAPFINAGVLSEEFNKIGLQGIKSVPISFIPEWSKYETQTCYGIELIITDKNSFKPVKTGLSLINLLLNLYPQQIKPHLYITIANPSGKNHLDKLTGLKSIWKVLSKPVDAFQKQINDLTSTNNWIEKIKPFLLY